MFSGGRGSYRSLRVGLQDWNLRAVSLDQLWQDGCNKRCLRGRGRVPGEVLRRVAPRVSAQGSDRPYHGLQVLPRPSIQRRRPRARKHYGATYSHRRGHAGRTEALHHLPRDPHGTLGLEGSAVGRRERRARAPMGGSAGGDGANIGDPGGGEGRVHGHVEKVHRERAWEAPWRPGGVRGRVVSEHRLHQTLQGLQLPEHG
mmetsp:Transcript_41447/g.130518  ORF Transcript_41447/g.130518 Transcript_41447/m.130518 type:complete len:201 (+) Transcript_41447:669-1271(+)